MPRIIFPAYSATKDLGTTEIRNTSSFAKALKMAWRSTGTSNSELVENMARHGLLKDARVKEAFLNVSFNKALGAGIFGFYITGAARELRAV